MPTDTATTLYAVVESNGEPVLWELKALRWFDACGELAALVRWPAGEFIESPAKLIEMRDPAAAWTAYAAAEEERAARLRAEADEAERRAAVARVRLGECGR